MQGLDNNVLNNAKNTVGNIMAISVFVLFKEIVVLININNAIQLNSMFKGEGNKKLVINPMIEEINI